MPMTLLLVAAAILLVILLYFADRAIKARVQRRRLRVMEERLEAARSKAEAKVEQQRRAAQAREALTSVMPGIHEHQPRHVNEPSLSPPHSGPDDRRVA
jgi:F0F1-type ATP synthase membrane subunit b/b'